MKRIRKIIGIALLLTIIIGSVNHVSYILENKESKRRYSYFFEEEQNIDVLFFGSSHVRHGFFPMELWNDYGITSFNLAANGSTIPVSYWIFVNALDYHTPKVVIMDVYDIWPRVISSGSGQVHAQMDAFPLTKNKIIMINDLYNEDNLTDETINSPAYELYDKKYTLLWPFTEYHTRWNALTENDFITYQEMLMSSEIWKGSEPLAGVSIRQEKKYNADISGLVYDDLSEKYLLQMIDLCKQKQINLILINTGYDCSDTSKFFADSVVSIAQNRNVPYLDFTKMDIIDFDIDLHSSGENSHVNFSGAKKYTSYIGEYLKRHYKLNDHRNDIKYLNWKNNYSLYEESKVQYLKNSSSLTEYLMYLSDARYQTIIEIDNGEILENKITKNQLTNLGVNVNNFNSSTNMIVVDCKAKKGDCYSYEYNSMFDTILGRVGVYVSPDATAYGLYLNDKELKVQETGMRYLLRITVIDSSDGTIVDIRDFNEL